MASVAHSDQVQNEQSDESESNFATESKNDLLLAIDDQVFTVDSLIDEVKNKKNEVVDADSKFKNIKLSALLQAQTRTGLTAVSILGKTAKWEYIKQLIVKDEFSVLCNTRMHCGHLLFDFVTGSCCWEAKNCDNNRDKSFYKYFQQHYDEELRMNTDSTNISFGHRCKLVVELMKRKAKCKSKENLQKFVQIAARRCMWDIVQQMISLQHESQSDSLCNTKMHCGHLLLDFASASCCNAAENFHFDKTFESRKKLVKKLMVHRAKTSRSEPSKLIKNLEQKWQAHRNESTANYQEQEQNNDPDESNQSSEPLSERDQQSQIDKQALDEKSKIWKELASNAAKECQNNEKFCSKLKDILREDLSYEDFYEKLELIIYSHSHKKRKANEKINDNSDNRPNSNNDQGWLKCCKTKSEDAVVIKYTHSNTTQADAALSVANCAARHKHWTMFNALTLLEPKSIRTKPYQLRKWLFNAIYQSRFDAAELTFSEIGEIREPEKHHLLNSILKEVNKMAEAREWIGVCYLLYKLEQCEYTIPKSALMQLLEQAQKCVSYETMRQLLLMLKEYSNDSNRRSSPYLDPFITSLHYHQLHVCELLLQHHKVNHKEQLNNHVTKLYARVVDELAYCHRFDADNKKLAIKIILHVRKIKVLAKHSNSKENRIFNKLLKAGNFYLLLRMCNEFLAQDSDESDKASASKKMKKMMKKDPRFALRAAEYHNCENVMKLLLEILAEVVVDSKSTDLVTNDEGTTIFQLCAQHQNLGQLFSSLKLLHKKMTGNEATDSFELNELGSKSLTCLNFACRTGNKDNIDFLHDNFKFYKRQISLKHRAVEVHCLETANEHQKLEEALKANCLEMRPYQQNWKENVVEVCKIIDKVENAFDLPDEKEARSRILLSDYADVTEFFERVINSNDSFLFKCGLCIKVWDPRDMNIRDIKLRDSSFELRASTGKVYDPVEMALRRSKTAVCVDFIKCSQFDIIPLCLQTLLQLSDYKGDMMGEDYHYLKGMCSSTICRALNCLYKDLSEEGRSLLFRYIMGEIEGGPKYPPLLSGKGNEEFSIYKLIQLADCAEALASKCMEHLVDRMWKHNDSAIFDMKSHYSAKPGSDPFDGNTDNQSNQKQANSDGEAKTEKPLGVSKFIKESKTARFNFWSDLILHAIFLVIFGIYLFFMTTTVSALDYLLIVYAADFSVKEIYDFVTQTMPPNVFLGKQWPTKLTHKLWMWIIPKYLTDYWNYFDLLSIALLTAGLIHKFQLTAASSESDLSTSRLLMSLSFFFFSFHSLSLMRYFKVFGPTISMIKSQLLRDLVPFMAIYVIISTGFGFFLFGLLYQGQYRASNTDTDFLIRLFTVPYLLAFGEFSSDSWDTCQFDNAANDQTIWGKSCPPLTVTRSYMSVVIIAFVIIANIVLFNLLIAKFSSTVSQKETKARQIWRKSKVLMLKEYRGKFYFPPPFLTLGLIAKLIYKYILCENILLTWTFCKSAKVGGKIGPNKKSGQDGQTPIKRYWWQSKHVCDYPEQYLDFLLLQAKQMSKNRSKLAADFSLDEEESTNESDNQEMASILEDVRIRLKKIEKENRSNQARTVKVTYKQVHYETNASSESDSEAG